jgi:(S)-mandelate dehydrogenase
MARLPTRVDTCRAAAIMDKKGEPRMAGLDDCYNIYDLREAARKRQPRGVFEFFDRGTEDEIALANNRAGFDKLKLKHRALIDMTNRTMATTLFGKPISMPMAIAPTGVAGMCWYHGELELAMAAAAAKIPFTLATGAMTPMEEIAEKAAGRLWMQLYVWEKRELSYELINRAKNCGFEALIVTVDTGVSPNREYNAKNGFHQPFRMTTKATLDMLSRPRWMATVLARYAMKGGLPKYENYPKHLQHSIRTDPNVEAVMRRDSLSWEDIKIFRKMWPGILMVKGINRPDDAIKAAEYGCDGIIVSNHGGRQLDGAVAAITVLQDIVVACPTIPVMMDGGVRRGTDVLKALALGAAFVFVGRPFNYAGAIAGEVGITYAINLLLQEVSRNMAMLGVRTLSEISPGEHLVSRA